MKNKEEEKIVTVYNVLQEMNQVYTLPDIVRIGQRTLAAYKLVMNNEVPPRKTQHEGVKKYRVRVYTEEFKPVIENIIKDYFKII